MKFNKLIILIIIQFNIIKCFIFSVIISIYNTARYLDDSIGSLLNQTIGFEHIQIILVNDGSTDDSEMICLKYKNLYNNNIIYLKIGHSGVSNVRNIGLDYAKGKYINFLDSDDKWDKQTFKYVYLFFKYYKNINLIGCRIKYFESSDKFHFLDYKFKKTRILDLNKEYNFIHLSVSSSFFKRSIIKGNKFKEGLLYGEDTRYIFNILLINPMIGLIREAVYYYRKRSDFTSAMQKSENNKDFYLLTIESVHKYLIEKSIKLYDIILPFIQFYLVYDILFRIQSKAYKFIDSNTYHEYCKSIIDILNQIEDKYFLTQNIFTSKIIMYALSIKYKTDLRENIILQNNSLIYLNYIFVNLNKYKNLIIWKILELKDHKLHLEGEDRCWLQRKKYFYYCIVKNKIFYPNYYYSSRYDFDTMFGKISKGRVITFDIDLDINDLTNIKFYLSYLNINTEILTSFDSINCLPPIKNSYYTTGDYILTINNSNLFIYPYKEEIEKYYEYNYFRELKKLKKDQLILIRKKIKKEKTNKKLEIWLITDMKEQAADNGEYFFKYLNKNKYDKIRYYFAIAKNCTDYKRLQIYDNVIDIYSAEYLKIFLNADKIISSVSEKLLYNPFGEDGKYMSDLLKFNFIYLGGIIKDYLYKYLNKIETNFYLIIASSKQEYNYIINSDYGYNRFDIVITGFPRFDNLKKLEKRIKKEKIILIYPTCRLNIKGINNLFAFNSISSENFNNTNYFNFYNNLINDKILLNKMNEYNFTGILCIDINFEEQSIYFQTNELFKVYKRCNQQKLLVKSSLLITDYSNIFFDFGYLSKPVIYFQFDFEDYRKNDVPQGYFDYHKDGFGQVCNDINCTVTNVIYLIENNCNLKKSFLRNVKKFFRFMDENNCLRTYNEIIQDKINKSINRKKYNIINIFNLLIINILFFKFILYKKHD